MPRNVTAAFVSLLRSAKAAPPGHEFYGNQWAGGGGGGEEGGPARLSGATVADSTLHWKDEETIRGELTLELPAGTVADDMTPDDISSFVRGAAGLSMIGARSLTGTDVAEVTVKITDQGHDWLVAQVEITPTEEAGARWQDQMDQEEQWAAYHPGEKRREE